MSDTKLKPCPFCGGKAEQETDVYGNEYIYCSKCQMKMSKKWHRPTGTTEINLIKTWNIRKPIDRIVEQLEERKDLHNRLIDYEHTNGTITEAYHQRKAVEVLEIAIELVKAGGIDERPKQSN